MTDKTEKIEIENVNTPGRTFRVDRAKYTAMRHALLKAIPKGEPGITAKDMKEKLLQHLPDDLFPMGEKAGWWMKAVQLDLEAKQLMSRVESKPLRFYKN